jgi:hypothetical protein
VPDTHLLGDDCGVHMDRVQTIAKLRDAARDLVEVNHLKSPVSLYHVHDR